MMKRWGISLFVAAMLLTVSVPTHANVVTSGTPGHPISAQSNPGSAAGQTHRSATGSLAKVIHDRAVYIWDF